MNYKLDEKSIESFSAYPCVDRAQECIALSGVFDLPKRKGTTEYNWGTSIEAFVDKEDIELDGRTLTFKVCIKGVSYKDYSTKLETYKSACLSCRKLSSDFGTFDIVMKDTLNVEEYTGCNMAIVTTKFWQQKYSYPELIIKPAGNGSFLMDDYDLSKDFGIYIASRKSDKNIPKRIEVNTTLPYTQTRYRVANDITFTCSMIGKDLQDLYSKMMQFQALCIKPGIRTLVLPRNGKYNIYFKDGITVKARLNTLLKFDLKCKVVT